MIDRFGGAYILTCDICDEATEEDFYEFSDAVDYKKSEGWKSQKRNGEWQDVCPGCAKLK